MTKISEGIKLFNDADYFSAHDFFEDLWREADTYEKDFFQGLVQLSVGCYHLICGNYKGSLSQLTKGTTKLKKYQPSLYGLDLNFIDTDFLFLIKDIKNYFSDNDFEIDLQKIPKINYQ